MPTPSSNPPDPPHSGASHSFPSCPEDAHHRSQNARSRATTTSGHHQAQTITGDVGIATRLVGSIESYGSLAPVPTEFASPTAMEPQTDGPISTAPSSRATTSSPAPDRPTTAASTITSISPTTSFQSDDDEYVGSAYMEVGDGKKNTNKTEAWLATDDSQSTRGRVDDTGRKAIVQTPIIPTEDGWAVAGTDRDEEITSRMHSGFPSSRMLAWSSSSLLRPGSRFHGTQQSERQIYDVHVEIQQVDLRESYLCGFLEIHGLTDEHPILTTFFEGEIIGTKYSFMTNHPGWGACDKIDLSHWSKFNAFRPLAKHAKRAEDGAARALRRLVIPDITQQENIFMRWKEQFLVPDHRVRTIANASFEGFYYICFNQLKGEVSGIYFHHKSEKFQQLELKHVPDNGCFHAMEFR